jgi:hypothetical protein
MFSSITIPILLLTMILTQSPSLPRSQDQCQAAPSRNTLVEILGKPVESVERIEQVTFRKNSISVSAHFDSSNRAETIFMSDSCRGIHGLTELMNKLVPKYDRGKMVERPIRSDSTICYRTYVEQYECLTIEYSEEMCMNCSHAGAKIKWK